MSQSLLRGLRILEMLGEEPVGVSELARRLEVDKAGVSRVLAALHREGWVQRNGRRYVLGRRALDLGDAHSAQLVAATAVVRELGDSTGLTAAVLRLAGRAAQPLVVHGADASMFEHEAPYEHLAATAAGLAVLAQVAPEDAEARLAEVDWADLGGDSPEDVAGAHHLLEQVRGGGAAVESGWTSPRLGCVALPWPLWPDVPCAVVLVGEVDDVASRRDELVASIRTRIAREGTQPAR
ncbi:MAG: helix-turn-helix domain-containing protein [Nocardioides sp.]|nr:helix-turn-helix domain-containing protein [Nocardioides sp.]